MIELPTERSVVTNYNPKLLILMGRPKQGKSSFVAAIDDNLIIDYKFELDKNIDPIKTSLYEIFCILSDKGIVIKFI